MVSAPLSQDSSFLVLPWNGYKAALSLTFDDGNPVHVDFVVPELVKRSLRGTFYVIVNRLTHPEKWMGILGSGQEIGNHSLEHKHVKDLSPTEEHRQVTEGKNRLEDLFGVPIQTFAYPFTEITPGLKKIAESLHFLSRGGNRSDFYMTPDMEPDWADIPSQVALTKMQFQEYQAWADENLQKGSWTVLQFHGIEGDVTGWQPLTKKIFISILDYLVEKQKDLWIAPFAQVGAYWRAQKILEKAIPVQKDSKTVLVWEKPRLFPEGVLLKVKLGAELQASQYGQTLGADSNGFYPVEFDAKELTLQP